MRDFETRFSQLLVIESRDDSSDPPQVLTSTGKVKKGCFERFWSHTRCMYILWPSVKPELNGRRDKGGLFVEQAEPASTAPGRDGERVVFDRKFADANSRCCKDGVDDRRRDRRDSRLPCTT